MSKLYFKYGAMGAGKSDDLIRTRYSYIQKNMIPFCWKSSFDTRDSNTEITSRTGLRVTAVAITPQDNLLHIFENDTNCDIILIDEAQFLAKEQIDQMRLIIEKYNIPIICYGMKVSFQSYLFDGSKRLLEIADDISEIKSICWCGKKAIMNARIVDGEMVTEGELIVMGADESYTALCAKHYFNKEIHGSKKEPPL